MLGSFYLRPVDQLMASSFESWHRNTHDIVYFFRNDRIQNSGLRLLADGFAALGLQIALDKTKPADNCLDALALIRRAALDYLTEGLRTGPPGETGDVRLYFDERRAAEEFDFIDQSSVLGVLAREGDPHAVRAVATEPELFRRNPVGCADYLLTTAQSDGDCVDAVTETALDPGAPPAVWTRST